MDFRRTACPAPRNRERTVGDRHESGGTPEEAPRKRKRLTEEQVFAKLKEAAGKNNARQVVRPHGVTETTFCRWKAHYGGMCLPLVKRRKALSDENSRLQRLVAELT